MNTTVNLPDDIIFGEIIMNNPDVTSIISLCSSNKKYQDLCKNNNFWQQMYRRYFGNGGLLEKLGDERRFTSYYELFKSCFALRILIGLNYLSKYNIMGLYSETAFYLSYEDIQEIPKEIGTLVNLKELDLSHNKIEEIPNEIVKLINLEGLYLDYNEIKKIPKGIGELG